MATWLLDLDGVVWRGQEPIGGASGAVERIRAAGHRVVVCTNNSHATIVDYETKLARHGIEYDGLVTSAMATATIVRPGERVLLLAGPGAREAMERRGASVVAEPDGVDAVIVGFDPTFGYAALRRATRAVLAGARLIATNDDAIFPMADGPAPGAGAILASLERATGQRAEVAGKPYAPMAELIRSRWPGEGLVVGDSPATDGALAAALGWPFGLVLSGNTTVAPSDGSARWVAADLATLAGERLP